MTRLRFPLAASAGGHLAIVVFLALFVRSAPTPPQVPLQKSFEVALSQPLPPPAPPALPEPPPAGAAPPPPDTAAPPPLQSEEPATTPAAPPAPAPEVPAEKPAEPPPPPKPVAKPRPIVPPPPKRPIPPRRPEPVPVTTPAPAPLSQRAPPPLGASAATSLPVPAAPPRPEVAASYRSALSGWFESHKHYPEAARQRSEQGSAVIRFRVDRAGRLLDYALVRGTGYPELDAAIDHMMRGAVLPPFPSEMTANDLQVSMTIHFGLVR